MSDNSDIRNEQANWLRRGISSPRQGARPVDEFSLHFGLIQLNLDIEESAVQAKLYIYIEFHLKRGRLKLCVAQLSYESQFPQNIN